MVMIMLIIIVALLCQICRESAFSHRVFTRLLDLARFFSLSPGRVHRHHPCVRPTAAKGSQYLAHNIMHRRSHQRPQCRTVSATPAPASQDGGAWMPSYGSAERQRERERNKQITNKNCESCVKAAPECSV